MESPYQHPAPDDNIARVHEFARDLAYGAANGLWHTNIQWKKLLNPDISKHSKIFAEHLNPKWGTDFPSEYLLLSFGYFSKIQGDTGYSSYLLTEKAFALLDQPVNEPKVFVSYRRAESTTFALLIEARLRIAGNRSVFVDKLLEIGGDWRTQLEQQVTDSDYFIVLIGETTFESEWVRKETELAATTNSTIIPIWHPNVRRDATTPQIINERQEIRVERETAEGYETAITKLLGRMGYSTY